MFIINKKKIVLAILYGGILDLSGCASITSEVICGDADENHGNKAKIGSVVKVCNNYTKVGDGIVYYLPKRDIRIDITVAKAGQGGSSASSSSTINLTIPSDSPQNISATITPSTKSEISKIEKRDSNNKEDSKSNDDESANSQKTNANPKMKVTVTIPNNRDTETLPDLENIFLLRYNKNWIGDNNMAVGVSPLGLLTVTHADTINKINDIAANIAIDAAAISMGAGALLKTSDTARATALPTTTINAPSFTPSGYAITFT